MSSGKSPGLSSAFFNWFLNSNLAQSGFVFALYTASPSAQDNPATNEATYGGYARSQNVSLGNGGLVTESDYMYNGAALTFGECTDGGGQVITSVAMVWVYNGGNICWWGDLDEPITTVTGTAPVIGIGQFSVTED